MEKSATRENKKKKKTKTLVDLKFSAEQPWQAGIRKMWVHFFKNDRRNLIFVSQLLLCVSRYNYKYLNINVISIGRIIFTLKVKRWTKSESIFFVRYKKIKKTMFLVWVNETQQKWAEILIEKMENLNKKKMRKKIIIVC